MYDPQIRIINQTAERNFCILTDSHMHDMLMLIVY